MFVTPCITAAMRSRPAPVSTDGFGSGVSLPSAERSNCMNTRFQISTQRSPSASGEPGGPPATLGAVVVEDLAARAARARVSHLPEVVGAAVRLVVADAHDLVGGQPDHLVPEVVRLVVGRVDRDHEALRIDLQRARDEIPAEADRILLEVVAEREVAEHLEERVVARRVADVLEVVVLAARAHAALAGRRAHVVALVLAEEAVLELHHAGVREQQRRVVAGHER